MFPRSNRDDDERSFRFLTTVVLGAIGWSPFLWLLAVAS
jgi:hypothetical protein